MAYKNFAELIDHVKSSPSRKRMVVACANDSHSIGAALNAMREGIVHPILVGELDVMKKALAELGADTADVELCDCTGLKETCELAVQLVREGKGDFLMKGKVDTSIFLREVVNKEHGLGKGGIMSHVTLFEVPTYHKLLIPVDGGMVPYPTLAQKKANGYGLYDMSGNVVEWCWDVYPYYSSGRYSRGGGYNCNDNYCKVDGRDYSYASRQNRYLGFRIVCSASN